MSKTTKYDETAAFAAIRERAEEDHINPVTVAAEIMAAESLITDASATLADRLVLSPVVAARCEKRGEATKVAAEVRKVRPGLSVDASKQAVTRIVKVGRLLAAHPGMDPLEAYALTNRATVDQVDAAVAAKDTEKAAAALARKPKGTGTKGTPKVKTPDSVREATHNTVAAAIEYILTHATEEQARAMYNTLASDLRPLAEAIKSGAHTWADQVTAEADAETDAAEEQEEQAS